MNVMTAACSSKEIRMTSRAPKGPTQSSAKARSKPATKTEVAQTEVASKPAARKAQAPKQRTSASAKTVHPNSKVAKILSLLKRPGGVSLSALMKATEWQAHSVRGFLSGTISKRMGLKLTSTRSDVGERVYSLGA